MTFPAVPWPLTSFTNHPTKTTRMAQGALLGRPTALFAGGVSPTTAGGSHGVVGNDDLLVTISAGLTLSIATGAAFINGTSSIDQGTYGGIYNNAAQTIALTATARAPASTSSTSGSATTTRTPRRSRTSSSTK